MAASTNLPQSQVVSRAQAKASIVIEGLSGLGKSGLAILIAEALEKDPDKIFAVDTEEKSLNLFDGIQRSTGKGQFGGFRKVDLLPSHGYQPSNYLALRERELNNGATVIINDSISHAWTRKGGILDLVETAKRNDNRLNNWTAWGVPEVAAEKELVYSLFRDYRCHCINTVRVKEKKELVDGELKSLGEAQIFMPETKFEPDLVLSMRRAGYIDGTPPLAYVTKSRYAILQEGNTYEFTESLLEQLHEYLDEGVDPEVLREKQRVEILEAIKEALDSSTSKQGIWPSIKATAGHADTPLEDIPLDAARSLYGTLMQ
jgi:hypothetical protein